MTHLEDVADKLDELRTKLDQLNRDIKKRFAEVDKANKLRDDALESLQRDFVDLGDKVGAQVDRLDALEAALGPVVAATVQASSLAGASASSSPQPTGPRTRAGGAAPGNGGSEPVVFTFGRPRDPRRDAVRTRGHDLAVASGYSPDPGSEPGGFSSPRFPTSAKPDSTAEMTNVPYTVGSITVAGQQVFFSQTGSTVQFRVPSGLHRGEVVRVEVEVPNISVFSFPLTIT